MKVKGNKRKLDYSTYILNYVLILSLLYVSAAFTIVLAIKNNNLTDLKLVYWIIGSALLIIVGVIISAVVWSDLFKYYRDKVDVVSIVLILAYLLISLSVSALVTIFSPSTLSFDMAERMTQISWIVFGISNALFLAGVSFVVSRIKEKNKQVLSNYSIYLYPMLAMSVVLVMSSIVLYCFYDNAKSVSDTLVYVSFITSILTVPYYLLLCFYLSNKNSKEKCEFTQDQDGKSGESKS